jgi:HlyD family secretion protein
VKARKTGLFTPRNLFLAGFAIVFLLFVMFAMRPQKQPVDAATIGRGGLMVTIDEEGETRVRDRYVVSSPLAARILRIELEPGDPVAAGSTILATLRPADPTLLDARATAEAQARARAAESAVATARAERDRAVSEVRFADADLARIARLHAEAIVSKEQLDAATLRADTRREAQRAGEFALRTAQHQLELARAALRSGAGTDDGGRLSPIEIRSPIDGVVLRRLRESEAVVAPGEALLELGAQSDIEIVSDLLSTDAVKIEAGSRVLIEQWGGEKPLEGKVRRVEPSGFTKISALGVEEQRVNVLIDIVSPREAWQNLGDGYRVEVRIVTWEKEGVLKVPTSALFRQGDAWAAFAIVEGRAEERKIEIGQRNGIEAEVLGGLAEGDRVVVHPSDQITNGVGIEIRQAP